MERHSCQAGYNSSEELAPRRRAALIGSTIQTQIQQTNKISTLTGPGRRKGQQGRLRIGRGFRVLLTLFLKVISFVIPPRSLEENQRFEQIHREKEAKV